MTTRLSHASGARREGFARTEAVAIVFIIALMMVVMLVIAPHQRRTAMLNRDLGNLRQIGAWTAMYANDFEDLHPSFTVAINSSYPDIQALVNSSVLRKATGQAIDIIRRRSGRDRFPIPSNWIPHVLYTHLVLADYLDRQLPDSTLVAAGDKHRMHWLDDPINKHDQGYWQPYQNPSSGPPSPTDKRWPYSSSFEIPSAFWDKRATPGQISQVSHNSYSVSGSDFGPLPLSNVAFPAQKVLQYAYGSWYASRVPQYFAADSSAVTVLMTDGGAALRRTVEANEGWRPTNPTSPNPTLFSYSPRSWEPPLIGPTNPDRYKGYYRWTRGRLDGRDFDGPEIDTGQK